MDENFMFKPCNYMYAKLPIEVIVVLVMFVIFVLMAKLIMMVVGLEFNPAMNPSNDNPILKNALPMTT